MLVPADPAVEAEFLHLIVELGDFRGGWTRVSSLITPLCTNKSFGTVCKMPKQLPVQMRIEETTNKRLEKHQMTETSEVTGSGNGTRLSERFRLDSQSRLRGTLVSLLWSSAGSSCRSSVALQLMFPPESCFTGMNLYSDLTKLDPESPTMLCSTVSPLSQLRVRSSAG